MSSYSIEYSVKLKVEHTLEVCNFDQHLRKLTSYLQMYVLIGISLRPTAQSQPNFHRLFSPKWNASSQFRQMFFEHWLILCSSNDFINKLKYCFDQAICCYYRVIDEYKFKVEGKILHNIDEWWVVLMK